MNPVILTLVIAAIAGLGFLAMIRDSSNSHANRGPIPKPDECIPYPLGKNCAPACWPLRAPRTREYAGPIGR